MADIETEDEPNATQSKEQHVLSSNVSDATFISRFYFPPKDLFGKDKRYLTILMRNSIFERILSKYLFQYSSKEFSLYPFMELVKNDKTMMPVFVSRMNYCEDKFKEEGPLSFFSELGKELSHVLKEDNLSSLKTVGGTTQNGLTVM